MVPLTPRAPKALSAVESVRGIRALSGTGRLNTDTRTNFHAQDDWRRLRIRGTRFSAHISTTHPRRIERRFQEITR